MDKEVEDGVFKFNAIGTCDNIDKNDEIRSNRRNPMEIILVITCVLQYLKVEDLKCCRFLNRDWSSEGLKFLKYRSKVVFRKGYGEKSTPARFFETFPDLEVTMPFTAFKIRGYSRHYMNWKITDLEPFFESQRDNIRELEIEYLRLVNESGETVPDFNITSWLSNSAMTKPNAKYHTKLSVSSWGSGEPTSLSVDISTIANVETLFLEYVTLHRQDEIKINPVNLKFHGLSCRIIGIRLCINDFVNLSKIKTMELYCLDRRNVLHQRNLLNNTAVISLDMGGNNGLKIQSIRLHGVKTPNIENCTWTIEKLNMTGCSFTERTGMVIKEFCFVAKNSILDFSVLPPTIEKLAVDSRNRGWIRSDSIFLPNLKSLFLNGDCLTLLPHFTKYPIVDLRLVYSMTLFEIQFACIPKTVKRLSLKYIKFKIQPQDETLKLEKLVVSVKDLEYKLEEIKEIFGAHLVTENLIVAFSSKIIPGERCLEFLNRCLARHPRLYFGPFCWIDDEDFKENVFANFVDMQSSYYLFENKKGKAIDMTEFRGLEKVGVEPVYLQE